MSDQHPEATARKVATQHLEAREAAKRTLDKKNEKAQKEQGVRRRNLEARRADRVKDLDW